MRKINRQPMPNDLIDGATVVASVWVTDEPLTSWLALLLRRSAPYFAVVEVDESGQVSDHGEFANIVPAVECYQDNGGDY